MLELTDIRKTYGNQLIFSIDQLAFTPGIYWLKGVNGSGKSTFLSLLAGLIPFKGSVLLDGKFCIRKQGASYRQLVNHAEAEPVYPAFLAGNELLDFVVTVKKGSRQQANEIQEVLGIDNYLANVTGSYSSGMLKKLSLLLAFIGQPRWILLDEPFTTLDQASQEALQKLIMQKHKKGISFIITSHHKIEGSSIDFTRTFVFNNQQLIEPIREHS